MDASPSAQVQLLDQSFSLTEDIADELEDFILLTRLGFHAEAEGIFREFLEPYQEYFPVMVENATRLISRSLPFSHVAVSRYDSASQPEYWLLHLMKCLSELYCKIKAGRSKGTKGPYSNDAGYARNNAAALAQEWHDSYQTLKPDSSSEVERHTTEVYLEIMVLETQRGMKFDRKYYQPPESDDPSSPQWTGFMNSCIRLNSEQRYWEAQQIVSILLPVLPSTEADSLFQRYVSSLEGTPLMTSTAVARLAASKSLLLRVLVDPENWIVEGTLLQTVQEAISIRPVVEYLFTRPEDVKTGIYDEWRQHLWTLIVHEEVKHNQAALSILLNAASAHGIPPFLWAAEKGKDTMKAMADIFSSRLGLQEEEVRAGFVKSFISWSGSRRRSLVWCALESDSIKAAEFAIEFAKSDPNKPGDDNTPPLVRAVKLGKIEWLQFLLGLDQVEPDLQDPSQRSALSWAAEAGSEQIVQLLTHSEKLNPDLQDSNGRTPLSWAAGSGHAQVVDLLVHNPRVNPNSVDSSGWTPLSWAAANGHHHVVITMLKVPGLEVDTPDKDARTALSWAAGKGHFKVVRLLLQDSRVDANSQDHRGTTPFLWAIAKGQLSTVRTLLWSDQVDVNMKDKRGRTPLTYVCENGGLDVAGILLLKHGADPVARDSNGWTPLMWAAASDRQFIVKQLLQIKGVDVNTADSSGRTAMSHAAERACLRTIGVLLNTADPDIKDQNGWSPLIWAAFKDNTNIARLLLQSDKVDVNTPDVSGRTAISHAAEHASVGMMRLLLSRADPDTKDHKGWTPLMQAADRGSVRLVQELLATGKVDPAWRSSDGWTAKSVALLHGNDAVVRLLDEHLAST